LYTLWCIPRASLPRVTSSYTIDWRNGSTLFPVLLKNLLWKLASVSELTQFKRSALGSDFSSGTSKTIF
jgi:hypothetical protein